MTEQQPGAEAIETGTNLNVGAVLREAREQNGLTVEDVAGRLKFAPRQIVALEEGDFAQLQGTTFIRGFVRAYARLMQLDEESLLSALPGGLKPAALEQKQGEPLPDVYAMRRSNILWMLSALGVALALVLFVWFHDSERDKTVTVNSENLMQPAVSAPASAMPESAVAAVSAPAAEGEAPARVATPEARLAKVAPVEKPALPESRKPAKVKPVKAKPAPPVQQGRVDLANSASAVQQEQVDSANPVPAAHQGPVNLRVVFDEDSWMEIRDASGTVLLSRLFLAGTEKNLNHVPPYSLDIGNAKGVRVYFKGEQVDLAPHTRTNVAHLTLE